MLKMLSRSAMKVPALSRVRLKHDLLACTSSSLCASSVPYKSSCLTSCAAARTPHSNSFARSFCVSALRQRTLCIPSCAASSSSSSADARSSVRSTFAQLQSCRARSGAPWSDDHLPRGLKERMDASDNQSWWLFVCLVAIFGGVFAFVPLYKLYCQHTGQGQAVAGHKEYSAPPKEGSRAADRLITVDFAGTVHTALPWKFVPQQRRIVVGLGETALAFYRAVNTSDRPIIGVSVYHMIPPEVGLYFNKIQCFCFDEQLINPGEEVDLPIFFFIDPIMGEDSRFDHIDHITLSYVFFESDSELPEEYEDYIRAVPSTKAPPELTAPKALPAAA